MNMKIEKQLTNKMLQLFADDLRFTKGASHCHTHNSVDDAVSTEKDVCDVAVENGASAAFISDHGTAMGWDDFDEAAQKAGTKPIFGIEAYYLDDVTQQKSHLCLYAKNNDGMRQMNMAMARGVILDDGRTCLTDETLKMLRGGNVIATSACIQGVFGSIVLYNNKINNKIDKLEREIAEFNDSVALYEKSKAAFERADYDWAVLKSEVSEAKSASKKSFAGKEKQLASMKKKLDKAIEAFDKFLIDGKDTTAKSVRTALSQLEVTVETPDDFEEGIDEAKNRYNQRVAQVKAESETLKALADTLDEKTQKMELAKAARTEAKSALDAVAKDVSKVETRKTKIAELEAEKLSKEASQELFNKRLATMLDVFGDNFYMEVQNHGLELEATIYPWIAKTAKKHKIPLIAANDAHVARNLPGSFKARQIRRSCRFSKWEEETDDMPEYYIKNDRELALALYQILPEDVVIEAMTNVAKVVDQCNATIVKSSHAPKAKVSNVKDEIIRLSRENIANKYGDSWGQKHEDRFNYEIGIIDSMGFSDYFYITWDILYVARLIGGLSYEKLDELKAQMTDMSLDELMTYLKEYSTEPNLSVGLGRGSGAGSIVCYLLGITNIDPFKYDLLFERERLRS